MTGEQLKAEGQAAAAKAAGESWRDAAITALKDFAATNYVHSGRTDFTIDEFRDAGACPEPANPNAWGSLPRVAVKLGVLNPTFDTQTARRPKAHARTVRVWKVNIDKL
ncbi:hypothetical protein [Burkholderia multivorans]|uniref:hypothetical protein n=1 Tax=Burkholderia multivorans TaxID=87883 RepID=UPI00158E4D63|nr:hypothetical protein [Burkholderia multivorans]